MGWSEESLEATAATWIAAERQVPAPLGEPDTVIRRMGARMQSDPGGLEAAASLLSDLSPGAKGAARVLSQYQLPISALAELAGPARVRLFEPDYEVLTGNRMVYFLDHGCVAERTRDEQVVRLWREGAVFGDQVALRRILRAKIPGRPTYLRFLSVSRVVVVPAERLQALAESDPSVALLFARWAVERASLVDRLYAATPKSPKARVAALLDYLADKVMRPQIVNHDDQKVVTGVRSHVVEGPTQLDIAEALGVGRATVERALRSLRVDGALTDFSLGSRNNRTYEITDRDLLVNIARGA